MRTRRLGLRPLVPRNHSRPSEDGADLAQLWPGVAVKSNAFAGPGPLFTLQRVTTGSHAKGWSSPRVDFRLTPPSLMQRGSDHEGLGTTSNSPLFKGDCTFRDFIGPDWDTDTRRWISGTGCPSIVTKPRPHRSRRDAAAPCSPMCKARSDRSRPSPPRLRPQVRHCRSQPFGRGLHHKDQRNLAGSRNVEDFDGTGSVLGIQRNCTSKDPIV